MRWRTPKRCCSSTIARRRSWKATSRWKSAWVPTTMAISPAFSARSFFARSAPLSRPVRTSRRTPAALGQRPQRGVVLAGEDLGGCHHRRLAAGLDRRQHGQHGNQRLARAHIALQQPVHPVFGSHVGGDLLDRAELRACRGVGKLGQHAFAQAAVAAGGVALGPLHPGTGESQRHLVREDLVVGQPLARRRGRRQVCRTLRGMGGAERGLPVGPAVARLEARLDPFRQRAHARQRLRHRTRHGALGEALGQRVDRLIGRQRLVAAGAQDMVGVDHLRDAVEQLDPAGDDAPLAGGELGAQPVLMRAEEHQLELGGRVAHVDAVGPAADGGGAVQADLHLDGQHLGQQRSADGGAQAAVDPTAGQGQHQVHRAGDLHAGKEPRRLRADAFEGGQLGEEREEDVWAAHRGDHSQSSRPVPTPDG